VRNTAFRVGARRGHRAQAGDFEAALEDGWHAFSKISAFLLKALIASLPILLLLVVAILVIKRVRKARMYR
jgi:hypothetical protein